MGPNDALRLHPPHQAGTLSRKAQGWNPKCLLPASWCYWRQQERDWRPEAAYSSSITVVFTLLPVTLFRVKIFVMTLCPFACNFLSIS